MKLVVCSALAVSIVGGYRLPKRSHKLGLPRIVPRQLDWMKQLARQYGS
jgi:hypothetical protein